MVVLLLGVSCKVQKNAADKNEVSANQNPIESNTKTTDTSKENQVVVPEDSVLLTIERTPCFGQCPEYSAMVTTSGKCYYLGENFVNRLGAYHGKMDSDKLAELLLEIERVKFFDFQPKYDKPVTDVPTVFVEVHRNGKVHRVMDRMGAPAELKSFEKYIDRLLETVAWKKNPQDDRK
jgi:hypothetical protein